MRGLRRRPRSRWCSASLAALVSPARGNERVVVALGDSLTAGLGVAPDEAWPALIEARLRREGYPYRVVNAGVSGDTTAGGLRRVDWVLRNRPEVAVVALGANDGLRGLATDAMESNLVAIVERLRAGGRAGPRRGDGGAAELRRGVHARVPRSVSRTSRAGRGRR